MNFHRILLFAAAALASLGALAADPTATNYSAADCQGTARPYPMDLTPAAVPDSFEVVMVNHLGRHGSRYMASSKRADYLQSVLEEARAAGALKPAGKRLLDLVVRVKDATAGRWGALDSLGVAEETELATRMAGTFPGLFRKARVKAMSSWSPRCIMSMYTFVQQLSRLDNSLEITTSSGRSHSALLRPFDADPYYREYADSRQWEAPVRELTDRLLSTGPLDRLFTNAYLPSDIAAFLDAEYKTVASVGALGWPVALADYFSAREYNDLWAIDNLRDYLRYSASTLTTATAEMAGPLLLDMIATTDAIVDNPDTAPNVVLRFAHAETIMPLTALIHLPGCYYMTNHFDTVALHWRDFYQVPMAANLRLVLLRHIGSGELYLRVDLNEQPVPLIPGRAALYTPWTAARDYLTRCLPLLLQP